MNRRQTIAWLTFDHRELHPAEIKLDLLREFLERHWRDAAPNTKTQHVSSLRCFFAWAYENDHIPENPAKRLRSPRKTETERRSHARSVVRQLVAARPTGATRPRS